MVGYIYKVTNLCNNKIYIGKRLRSTFDDKYYGSGSLIRAAVEYYGKENFKIEILEEIDDLSILDAKEIYWIDFYNSTNPDIGYNISKGGRKNDFLSANNVHTIFNDEIQIILEYKRTCGKKKKVKESIDKIDTNESDKKIIIESIPNFSFSISKDFSITKH